MKTKKLYELGEDWFSGLSVFEYDATAKYSKLGAYREKHSHIPLERCAVLVPSAGIGYGETCLTRSNYECFPRCRHVVATSCELLVLTTCNCQETHDALDSLESYPVLNDDDFHKREYEAKEQAWDDFGYDELRDLVAELLNLDSFGDLEIRNDKAREIVEDCYDVMNEDSDGSMYFDKRTARSRLEKYPSLWELVESADNLKEYFDNLDHKEYHRIFQAGIKLIDSETGEVLEVPDFIALQYSERQLKIV